MQTNKLSFFKEYEGAVSLTFDDGLSSQLDIGVPLLNKYNFSGTFYLCPKEDNWKKELSPWKKAAIAGHEIGNHSLSHACSISLYSKKKQKHLEEMNLEEIEKDIITAEERLSELFPAEKRSFAYPCYHEHVGLGVNRKSYVPVVAKYFVAGRGFGEFGNNYLKTCDLHYLWSWNTENMDCFELIGRVEHALLNRQWCILTFHQIGDGRLSVSTYVFKELLKYLASKSSSIFIDTVSNIAAKIKEEQNNNCM